MENKEIKDIMENRENNLQATCPVLFPENERADLKDIERSLIKRYRKNVWSKFVKAIKEYNLIEDGDKRKIFWNEEVLKQSKIKQPYISELAKELSMKGNVLSIDEFINEFKK